MRRCQDKTHTSMYVCVDPYKLPFYYYYIIEACVPCITFSLCLLRFYMLTRNKETCISVVLDSLGVFPMGVNAQISFLFFFPSLQARGNICTWNLTPSSQCLFRYRLYLEVRSLPLSQADHTRISQVSLQPRRPFW